MKTNIEWNYSGKPDGFFGTGATQAEQNLVWLFGILSTALLGLYWWSHAMDWSWWQYAIALLLALDVLGGVVANSLNSCKRFYHSPIQHEETGFTALAKNHFAFTLLHIHPILIGLVFGNMNLAYGIIWYVVMVIVSAGVQKLPLYLQRPAAMGVIMLAILINYYVIPPITGFEWFIPALFLKIVYGHIVQEEPYRA